MVRGCSLREAMRLSRPNADQTRHNVIAVTGKVLIAQFLIGAGPTGLTYCAIGDDPTAPTPGDTTLTDEVYRQAWDTRTNTFNGITLDVLIAAAHCTFVIQEGGVFGGAASGTPGSGTLFSHFLQNFDNSLGLYDLTFEYQVSIG